MKHCSKDFSENANSVKLETLKTSNITGNFTNFIRFLLSERKQVWKRPSKNDTFKFYVFRFLELWAWIIVISIHFLFRDICVNMTQVSSRLKFDTFFTLILSFENAISTEWTWLPKNKKKSSLVWQKLS